MIYVFGDYEVDTQLYELCCGGEPLKIEPQAFNVLAYLIEHHDRTVTRRELLDTLWPDQFTSEAVLSYCVMTARKAVGDSGRTQRVIKTLHGRGFRFIAPLEKRQPEPSASGVSTLPETPAWAEPPASEDEAGPAVTPAHVATPSTPSRDLDDEGQPVTVLCATLVNAEMLGEELGFADFQRLRQAFFTLAQDVAQQYKGTLQFFGADGILILFGAPIVCADPARQAVRAAMALQKRLGEPYTDPAARRVVQRAIRLGSHTGPMATERMPQDQRIAPTEMGETMHLAVWMQYLAEPGTLLSSEATIQQVQDAMRCAVSREVNIPGQPRPIRAYVMRESEG